MSSTETLRSIRCTACGAPLSLHGGGHKILTLNCQHCGAVLDARKEYAVLAQFKAQQKPDCPLDIGMQGKLKGVAFTIIGMVGRFAEGEWVDLLLFSATHGYAWLSYENGHFTFARRIRDVPTGDIWSVEVKKPLYVGNRTFKMYERYQADITYVAGELTWLAKVGDSAEMAEALAPPWLLSAERTGREMELYLCEYLQPADVAAAFQLTEALPERKGIHPAQPFVSPRLEALSRAARPFVLVAAVVMLFIWLFMGGEEVHREYIAQPDLVSGKVTKNFTIHDHHRLVEMQMETRLNNAWAYLDVTVQHNKAEIYSFGKEMGFYSGYDDEGYWEEGSNTAYAHFKVPEPGEYTLHVQESEGGEGDLAEQNKPPTALTIAIRESYTSPYYFVLLSILLAVAAIAHAVARGWYESRRWAAVTEDDD